MSKQIKSYFEATRYLGQYMQNKNLFESQDGSFLFKTSCMSMPRRKQIAVMSWLLETLEGKDLEKMAFTEVLKDLIIPLMEKLGYAEWLRDTVTDMAIRKGLRSEGETWGDEEIKQETTNAKTPSK